MITLSGSVTTVEKMAVEVTPQELSQQTQKNFSTREIVIMAYHKWLGTKGMGKDVQLRQTKSMGYFFEEYEDHGSHYSGYYEVRGAYQEGDEVIWEQFHLLLDKLK